MDDSLQFKFLQHLYIAEN